jgi:hypothetical protein
MYDIFETEMKRLSATAMGRRSNPTDSQLRQLEGVLGISFPVDYRHFLTNFGRFSVRAETPSKTLPGAYIEYFYGFPEQGSTDPESVGEFDELGLAPTAVTIGCDLFGNQFVMFLDEQMKGRIYVHEHDGGVDFMDDPDWKSSGLNWNDLPQYDDSSNKPEAFQNLHFIAPSFSDFLGALRPIET